MATSVIFDGAKLAKVAEGARYLRRKGEQAELGEPDEDEDGRVYTPEDEYAAGESLLAAMAEHDRAKREAKDAKAGLDDAAAEWRRVHRRVRLAREAGQW